MLERPALGSAEVDHHVLAIARDWRSAELAPADRALCAYADKLTRTPKAIDKADLEGLRAHGFDDRAIHDCVQIVGYFNYINRVAEALGVEPEDFVRSWERGPE